MTSAPHDGARTYYWSSSSRAIFCIAGGLLLLCAVGLDVSMMLDSTRSAAKLFYGNLIFVPLALFSLYLLISAFYTRLLLDGDQITLYDPPFSPRSIQRADVAGTRNIYRKNVPVGVILIPNRPGIGPVKIPDGFETDDVLTNWLGSFPNIDATAAQEAEAEIESDPALGSTPEARLATVASARTHVWIATVAASAILTICVAVASPPRLLVLILAALPWIAIWVVSRSSGLYRIYAWRSDPHVHLAAMFAIPSLGLALLAVTNVHVLDLAGVWIWAAIVAVALMAGAIKVQPELGTFSKVTLTLFVAGLSYGYGAIVLANSSLDRSPPHQYRALVTDMRVSDGRGHTRHLRLAPWGAQRDSGEIAVPPALYNKVDTGDSVCVQAYDGALRIGWYVVNACP
jgi:hypothetical protein